jgi:hypothetical protein
MKAPAKNHRERLQWLESPAVRKFSAQLRPKWTALRVFRGGLKGYIKGEAMSNLSIANNDVAAGANSGQGPGLGRLPLRPSDIVERIGISAASHEVTDGDAIGESLQRLADQGQPVTIYPAGADEPVLARIASVDPEVRRFTLELDQGATLPPGRCTFVTWLDAARFQFELTATWTPLPGQPGHVLADFPTHCTVLNRRSANRLETPLAGNFLASFVLFGNPYELQLYDVAVGGIGMRCSPREATGLHPGRKLQRVRLELGEAVVICDLEIRLARRFRSFLLGEQVQIGCRFVNLAPAMQAEIDKAISRMSLARR